MRKGKSLWIDVWSLIWTSALSRLTSICDLDIDYHSVDTDEEKFVCFYNGCGCSKSI